MKKEIIAYKAFEKDMTCKSFKYEKGKKYHHDGDIRMCENGFHASKYPIDTLRFYDARWSKFHKVKMSGQIIDNYLYNNKMVASDIEILEEIDLFDIPEISIKEHFKQETETGKNLICCVDHKVISEYYNDTGIKAKNYSLIKADNNNKIEINKNNTVVASSFNTLKINDSNLIKIGCTNVINAGSYNVIDGFLSNTVKVKDESTISIGPNSVVKANDNNIIKSSNYSQVDVNNNNVIKGEFKNTIKSNDNCLIKTNHYSKVTTGNNSIVDANDKSEVITKDFSIAITGKMGKSEVGKNSIAISKNGFVKGDINSLLIIIDDNKRYNVVRVDDQKIKANIYYKLVDETFVEASEDEIIKNIYTEDDYYNNEF